MLVIFFLQYFYNTQTQQFLYWDGERQTYLPAPTTSDPTAAATATTVAADNPDQKKDEQDEDAKKKHSPDKKIKVAKRLVKVDF